MRKRIANARRVIVKLGSSTIGAPHGGLDVACITGLAGEIVAARRAGVEIVIVSSGAILAGRGKLRITTPNSQLDVVAKQAIAAVGQVEIMRFWQYIFDWYGVVVGQILVTREVIGQRKSFINARHTLQALLARDVIPVVNENDSVAVEEIRLGDNDNLSAMVAGLVDAELLILLTDKDGLYSNDPAVDPTAKLIPFVSLHDDGGEFVTGDSRSGVGLGGMNTKVAAAKTAARFGVPTVIAAGKKHGILTEILTGREVGTLFEPFLEPLKGRKRWILCQDAPSGEIVVDDGARAALVKGGKSLLPSGILNVKGEFDQGDAVLIRAADGHDIARGLANYTADEIRRIKGLNSAAIESVLGYTAGEEVVHRDDFALLESP
ncbi:MAG: glutamate 5-kinase [Myxococcales bacterium]|nr:glutamate 5-kinase [Myxococcales bacterium]